jgi:hypothetical protein
LQSSLYDDVVIYDMSSLVTKRFIACLELLREREVIKSVRQFAITLDFHPQNLNDILKGKRDVTIDLIKCAVEAYHFNPVYIFTGEGDLIVHEEGAREDFGLEAKSEEKILYVPVAAQAGYAEQFNDPVFMEELVSFSLPDYKFRHGVYRCFDVAGDSMEPSLFSGDKVVCSAIDFINHAGSIRNNHVYVIVLESGILIKRVQNTIRENNSLTMLSDNTYYQPYDIPVAEVKELWHVEVRISPYLPSPHNIRNGFHDEMEDMKKIIDQQSRSILMLNQTVEKLLRQNRAVH